jgi:hypothetical protein
VTIEEAVNAKLRAVHGHARVYPDGEVPQDNRAWPVVTYEHLGDDDRVSLDAGRAGVRVDEFAVYVLSPKRADCVAGRELMKAAFAGYNAAGWWGGTGTGVYVSGAVCKDSQGEADSPFDGSEELNRSERQTLRVNWKGA